MPNIRENVARIFEDCKNYFLDKLLGVYLIDGNGFPLGSSSSDLVEIREDIAGPVSSFVLPALSRFKKEMGKNYITIGTLQTEKYKFIFSIINNDYIFLVVLQEIVERTSMLYYITQVSKQIEADLNQDKTLRNQDEQILGGRTLVEERVPNNSQTSSLGLKMNSLVNMLNNIIAKALKSRTNISKMLQVKTDNINELSPSEKINLAINLTKKLDNTFLLSLK